MDHNSVTDFSFSDTWIAGIGLCLKQVEEASDPFNFYSKKERI